MTVLSNADALLVGVPMIGLLLVCHFRLDELVGKPRKRRKSSLPARKFSVIDDGFGPSIKPGSDGSIGEPVELPAQRRPRVRAEME